jgi:hypothetical protein
MDCPQTWLEATKRAKDAQQVMLVHIIKPAFVPCPKPTTTAPHATPLKVQKLTWAKMDDCQLKGLYYICDDIYFPGHKCKEHKIFMAILEDVSNEDVEVSPEAEIPQNR